MELIPLHSSVAKDHSVIRSQCTYILNFEWPRSETLRHRTLDSSRPDLPMCLALVQWFDAVPAVLGHCRLSKILSDPDAVYLESVIIHPDLRGQGIGKYLMLLVESFCTERGFTMSYLTTTDQQIFYSKLGYAFCEPVMAYNGNLRLPPTMVAKHSRLNNDNNNLNKNPVYKTAEELAKLRLNSAAGKRALAAQSPGDSSNTEKVREEKEDPMADDIAVQCAKVFARPQLTDTAPPFLSKPPRLLQPAPSSSGPPKPKTNKSEIHRVNLRHDFMRKKL